MAAPAVAVTSITMSGAELWAAMAVLREHVTACPATEQVQPTPLADAGERRVGNVSETLNVPDVARAPKFVTRSRISADAPISTRVGALWNIARLTASSTRSLALAESATGSPGAVTDAASVTSSPASADAVTGSVTTDDPNPSIGSPSVHVSRWPSSAQSQPS